MTQMIAFGDCFRSCF